MWSFRDVMQCMLGIPKCYLFGNKAPFCPWVHGSIAIEYYHARMKSFVPGVTGVRELLGGQSRQ